MHTCPTGPAVALTTMELSTSLLMPRLILAGVCSVLASSEATGSAGAGSGLITAVGEAGVVALLPLAAALPSLTCRAQWEQSDTRCTGRRMMQCFDTGTADPTELICDHCIYHAQHGNLLQSSKSPIASCAHCCKDVCNVSKHQAWSASASSKVMLDTWNA